MRKKLMKTATAKENVKIPRILITGCLGMALVCVPAPAQESINKEVVVVKPYEPILGDVSRISVLPDLADSVIMKPQFSYSIQSRPLSVDFTVRPIQAARMESEALPELYNTFMKVGFGSYVTPLLQLNISSLRKRNHALGLNISHMSSQGKIRLDNDQKVFAGYGDNEIGLFGKRIFKNSVLYGDMGFATHTRYFYGYNTALDTIEFEKDDIRQRYLGFDADLGIKSSHLDSTRTNFQFDAGFRYLQDDYTYHAENVRFEGTVSRMFARGYFGLDTRVKHRFNTLNQDDVDFTTITVYPWWTKTTPEYRLRLGLDITASVNNTTRVHFYPNASFQFKVVENILVPYLGVSGFLEENDFHKISMENLFITPGLHVGNTDHKLEFYGGIKGNFSTRVSFKLKASYLLADNMYFFVNDSSADYHNTFSVRYDDVELMNYYAELVVYPSERINLQVKGNYYNYTNASADMKPWHKPAFDAGFSARYNLRNKILVRADVLVYGTRYAKNYIAPFNDIKMKGFADINLHLEYRYTKILSGFISLNNLASQRYSQWNQYPLQRLLVMAGFTYSM